MINTLKAISLIILLTFIMTSCSKEDPDPIKTEPKLESFTFTSNGESIKGKIYLPASYESNNNLPAIYLIDYQEQHFDVATDEFDQVVKAVQLHPNFDALVVTLNDHLNIDSKPEKFQDYYDVFKDMAGYVDGNYTNNTSRTFIGRGSEGGVVLLTLLREDPATSLFNNFISTDAPGNFTNVLKAAFQNDEFPINITNKKLHFSYSSSNDKTTNTSLISVIEDKQYPWLTFQSTEYSNDNFENTYKKAFAEGIDFIFD